MDEELTRDKFLSPVSIDIQHELVGRYCTGLEGRLRAAPDKKSAESIVENICSDFDGACESETIRIYLREYVHAKFTEIWKRK